MSSRQAQHASNRFGLGPRPDELQRIGEGVGTEEFDRARTGLQSRLVMQGESTSARAAAIAGDQFLRGAPRTLAELSAEVDAASADDLNRFLKQRGGVTLSRLTIGPEEGTKAKG